MLQQEGGERQGAHPYGVHSAASGGVRDSPSAVGVQPSGLGAPAGFQEAPRPTLEPPHLLPPQLQLSSAPTPRPHPQQGPGPPRSASAPHASLDHEADTFWLVEAGQVGEGAAPWASGFCRGGWRSVRWLAGAGAGSRGR